MIKIKVKKSDSESEMELPPSSNFQNISLGDEANEDVTSRNNNVYLRLLPMFRELASVLDLADEALISRNEEMFNNAIAEAKMEVRNSSRSQKCKGKFVSVGSATNKRKKTHGTKYHSCPG